MLSDWWAMWEARRYSYEAWDAPQANLGRDRRVFRRIAMQVPFDMVHRSTGAKVRALTLDMSLGGAGLVAPVSWPEGSLVSVRFETLQWSIDGALIFCRPAVGPGDGQWRYGLKFLRLGVSDLWRVRRILRGHFPGPLTVH